MPTHYDIAMYWKTKYIQDNGTLVDCPEYCSNILSEPDCPICFACGKILYPNDYLDTHTLKQIWNNSHTKHQLQKCHIYPKALGGENVESNLFLMCSDCHRDSPDTIYRDMFFKWVRQRQKDGPTIVRAYRKALEICAEKNWNLAKIIDAYDMSTLLNEIYDELNTHGFNYSETSYIAWFIKRAEKEYT